MCVSVCVIKAAQLSTTISGLRCKLYVTAWRRSVRAARLHRAVVGRAALRSWMVCMWKHWLPMNICIVYCNIMFLQVFTAQRCTRRAQIDAAVRLHKRATCLRTWRVWCSLANAHYRCRAAVKLGKLHYMAVSCSAALGTWRSWTSTHKASSCACCLAALCTHSYR